MGLVVVGVGRRWEPDVRADDDERRPIGHGLGVEHGLLHRRQVFGGLAEFDHVPAVRCEPCRSVVGERQLGDPVDGDVVVVVEGDEATETEMSGQ